MRILRATIFNAGVGWVVGKGVVRAAKLPFSLTNDPLLTVKSDEGSSVVKKIQDCCKGFRLKDVESESNVCFDRQ